MKKLFILMILGSVTSLSANYGSCPNCPASGGGYYQGQGYQGGGYYQGQSYQDQGYQGGSYQGNEGGYYRDGSRPVLVGTRPGRANDQNQQYNQNMQYNRY